jgi:hypothetical protein
MNLMRKYQSAVNVARESTARGTVLVGGLDE